MKFNPKLSHYKSIHLLASFEPFTVVFKVEVFWVVTSCSVGTFLLSSSLAPIIPIWLSCEQVKLERHWRQVVKSFVVIDVRKVSNFY